MFGILTRDVGDEVDVLRRGTWLNNGEGTHHLLLPEVLAAGGILLGRRFLSFEWIKVDGEGDEDFFASFRCLLPLSCVQVVDDKDAGGDLYLAEKTDSQDNLVLQPVFEREEDPPPTICVPFTLVDRLEWRDAGGLQVAILKKNGERYEIVDTYRWGE